MKESESNEGPECNDASECNDSVSIVNARRMVWSEA